MSDILFLLGAGASASAASQRIRDVFGEPPLGNNMGIVHERISRNFGELRSELRAQLGSLTQIVDHNLGNQNLILADLFPKNDPRANDYEYFLSLLDVADAIESMNGNAAYAVRAACRKAIIARIIIVLLAYYSECNGQNYETLADFLVSRKCTCVSFNWDLLLEDEIIRKYPNISLSSLYGFTINRFGQNSQLYDYCLLKPHGSINWRLRVPGDKKYEVEFVDPSNGDLDGRLLMAPGYFKPFKRSVDQSVLRYLLEEVAFKFAFTSRLVIIGYSFSKYDFYMDYFLRRRANAIKEVHILDPHANEVWQRIEKLLNTKNVRTYPGGFSDIHECLSTLK